MDKLTARQLQQKLNEIGFNQYSSAFLQNEICGADIPYITEDHLIEMGIELIGHRMLLMKRLDELYNGKYVDPVNLSNNSSKSVPRPKAELKQSASNNIFTSTKRNYDDNSDSENHYEYKAAKQTAKISRTPKNDYYHSESDETDRRANRREPTPMQQKEDIPRPILRGSGASSSSRQDFSDSDHVRPTKRETPKLSRATVQNNAMEEKRTQRNEPPKINEASSSIRSSTSKLQTKPPQPTLQPVASDSNLNTQDVSTQDGSDRVVCQYCGRKFLPDAARRHIPVCGRIRGMSKK